MGRNTMAKAVSILANVAFLKKRFLFGPSGIDVFLPFSSEILRSRLDDLENSMPVDDVDESRLIELETALLGAQVEGLLTLFENGATIGFVERIRREMTGELGWDVTPIN